MTMQADYHCTRTSTIGLGVPWNAQWDFVPERGGYPCSCYNRGGLRSLKVYECSRETTDALSLPVEEIYIHDRSLRTNVCLSRSLRTFSNTIRPAPLHGEEAILLSISNHLPIVPTHKCLIRKCKVSIVKVAIRAFLGLSGKGIAGMILS